MYIFVSNKVFDPPDCHFEQTDLLLSSFHFLCALNLNSAHCQHLSGSSSGVWTTTVEAESIVGAFFVGVASILEFLRLFRLSSYDSVQVCCTPFKFLCFQGRLPVVCSEACCVFFQRSLDRNISQNGNSFLTCYKGVSKRALQLWKLIEIYTEDIHNVLNCQNVAKHTEFYLG